MTGDTQNSKTPDDAAAPRTFVVRGLRWYIAILLMMATTINYLDRQTLSVAAPIIKKDFHLNNQQYAAIGNGFLIAYAIMHPISGRLMDWLGTRMGMTLAVIWWSLASMAHAFARGMRSMRGLRFLLGVGEAGNFPAAIKSVSEWFPASERSLATGILNVGSGLGAIAAPPVVYWLMTLYNWRLAFMVTGALGLIWSILWIIVFRRPEDHPWLGQKELAHIRSGQVAASTGTERGSWRETLTQRNVWALMVVRFMSDPAWFFYLFWLPSYLTEGRHLSMKVVALCAWVPYVAADFGSLLGGAVSSYLMRRGFSVITARKIAMCLFAAMMPAAIPAVLASTTFAAVFFISIATTGHQAWSANSLTLPADLFPKRIVALAYGFTGMAAVLSSALLNHYVGWMVDHMGYTPVFMIVGCLHPIAALILVLFVHNRPMTGTSLSNEYSVHSEEGA